MTRARDLSRFTNPSAVSVEAGTFNVGIGSDSPDVELDVIGSIEASGISTFQNNLFVGAGITMLASSGIVSAVSFYGDFYGSGENLTGVASTDNILSNAITVSGVSTFSDNVSIGDSIFHTGDTDTAIRFPTANTFTVETAGSERVRIDSSGNIGIGTNNPTGNGSETSTHIHATNYPILHLTNSATGTSASDGSELTLNNDGSLILRNRENSFIRFDTNGSERLRIQSAGGISFNGDTAAANALDDYEEGTFVPELANSGTSLTLGSSYNDLHYTKIGQLVTINGRIQITSASGSSGAVFITNLPFVCRNGNDTHGTLNCYGYNFDIPTLSPASTGVIYLEIAPNDNNAFFVTTRDDATWSNIEGSAFDSGNTFIHIQGTYLTDS